jgi:NADP-dependent 3-hydroxy acid dehydrogenase YdfG
LNSTVTQQPTQPQFIGYAASKHALKSVADGIRNAANGDGIRVLSVYPGSTATPMQEAIFRFENRAYRDERLLQPEDVAEAILGALVLPRTAELTELFIRPLRNNKV